MSAKSHQLVLNGTHALDVACNRIKSIPVNDPNTLYEAIIRPFKAPKTWKQLKTLHMLFNELSATNQNEYAGNTSEWWKSYYKLRIYMPILKNQAFEDDNTEFIKTVEKLGNAWREASEQNKPTIELMITSSSEFSFTNAKKDHLIQLIDLIMQDASKKGIYLEIKKSDYQDE